MTRPYSKPLNPSGGSPREISEAVNKALRGKINSIGTVTLTPSSATTALENPEIGLDSLIFLQPMTANARAEGNPWFQVTTKGQLTLNHANNAQADRTFAYVILG